MTSPRDAHAEAAQVAMATIGELQEALALASDRAETAMGAVNAAVGNNPSNGEASEVANLISSAHARINEVYHMTEIAVNTLTSYASGF